MSEKKKLSHEELMAYSDNLYAQASQLYRENSELKKVVTELSSQKVIAEVNLAFKVLEYKDMFDSEFVDKIVAKIVEILTPPTKAELENNEEGNDTPAET